MSYHYAEKPFGMSIGSSPYHGDLWLVAGVAALLTVSGSDQVDKYVGAAGVGVYAAIVLVAVWITHRWLVPRFWSMGRRTALALAILTIAMAGLAFGVLYPLADAGVVGGGSDSDDALNLATRALLHGQYPYRVRTYLGAGATYLPGSLLLALPFTILGNAAYQNLFWLAVLLWVVATIVDVRLALLLVWTVLALCPRVGQLIITGGELLASGIYVPVAVLFAIEPPGLRWWNPRWWIRCVLLGLAVSSRINYLLLIPVVLAAIARQQGCRRAVESGAVIAATMIVVIGPFWLYDPAAFWRACIEQQNAAFALLLPSAQLVVPFVSVAFALAVAIRPGSSRSNLLLRCVAIQAFPVLLLVAVSSIQLGAPNFIYAGYGIHFLFFGLLGLWAPFASFPIDVDPASWNIKQTAAAVSSGK
jgi:hypothetical protein